MSSSANWPMWSIGIAGGCVLILLLLLGIFLWRRRTRRARALAGEQEERRREGLLATGEELAVRLKTYYAQSLSPRYREELEIRVKITAPALPGGQYSIVLAVRAAFGNRRALYDDGIAFLRAISGTICVRECTAKVILQIRTVRSEGANAQSAESSGHLRGRVRMQ